MSSHGAATRNYFSLISVIGSVLLKSNDFYHAACNADAVL